MDLSRENDNVDSEGWADISELLEDDLERSKHNNIAMSAETIENSQSISTSTNVILNDISQESVNTRQDAEILIESVCPDEQEKNSIRHEIIDKSQSINTNQNDEKIKNMNSRKRTVSCGFYWFSIFLVIGVSYGIIRFLSAVHRSSKDRMEYEYKYDMKFCRNQIEGLQNALKSRKLELENEKLAKKQCELKLEQAINAMSNDAGAIESDTHISKLIADIKDINEDMVTKDQLSLVIDVVQDKLLNMRWDLNKCLSKLNDLHDQVSREINVINERNSYDSL